ncbi:MAG: hypothetical protein ICV86_15355 [Microcoleus sp. T3-bin5]|nr:hypothetical protein [Microcoleus sp. T3-bin5]
MFRLQSRRSTAEAEGYADEQIRHIGFKAFSFTEKGTEKGSSCQGKAAKLNF